MPRIQQFRKLYTGFATTFFLFFIWYPPTCQTIRMTKFQWHFKTKNVRFFYRKKNQNELILDSTPVGWYQSSSVGQWNSFLKTWCIARIMDKNETKIRSLIRINPSSDKMKYKFVLNRIFNQTVSTFLYCYGNSHLCIC